ncbi:MAG: hypothetical protein RLZZ272_1055 [Actinomycetota bacterium]
MRADVGGAGVVVDVAVPIAGAPDGYGLPAGTFHDASGRLTYAFGTLGRPERVGTYRTVGLDVAAARLRTLLVGAPGAVPDPAPTAPSGSTSGAAPGTSNGAPPDGIVVRLVAVELVGALAFGLDGEALLVPHYRFTAEDGTTHDVLAVDERHLDG